MCIRDIPGSDREVSERLFLESMLELKPYIEEKKVQVLMEATNHKEASIIRTLKEMCIRDSSGPVRLPVGISSSVHRKNNGIFYGSVVWSLCLVPGQGPETDFPIGM